MSISRLDYENMRNRTERARHTPAQAVKDEIADLHAPILKWCKDNGAAYIHSRTDKKSRCTPGAPDFVICWKGSVHLIECKAEGGELSPAQRAWIRQAEDQRAFVRVVATWFDFCAALNL